MGRIAVCQVVSTEVEHPDKDGHEHHRVIGRGDGMIHLPHDVGRTLIVTRQIPEQRPGDGHIERRRHALSRHVADDEEQLVTLDDEIIEITAHLLGGRHCGKKVQVVTLREDGGDHPHLNVVGDHQFTLQTFLACRRHFQVLDILFQRRLHIPEGLAQLQQFVLRVDLRQRRVEITLGDAHRRFRELSQRACHLIDGPCAEDE